MSETVTSGTGDRAERTAVEVFDSPNPWVADHIRRFVESHGKPRPGTNDLLLTTRGRRSGNLRRTVLVYAEAGDRYVVAASNAGADQHPAWYLNLVADPAVTVQIGTSVLPASARVATVAERPALWQTMITMMPSYQEYQKATTREIPLVIIELRPRTGALDATGASTGTGTGDAGQPTG